MTMNLTRLPKNAGGPAEYLLFKLLSYAKHYLGKVLCAHYQIIQIAEKNNKAKNNKHILIICTIYKVLRIFSLLFDYLLNYYEYYLQEI